MCHTPSQNVFQSVISDDYDTIYERIKQVTNTRTQVELADILKVRQSSISDVKRRKSIPSEWYQKLLESHWVNPIWLKTGNGPVYLDPTAGSSISPIVGGPFDPRVVEIIIRKLIYRLSPPDMADEIQEKMYIKNFTLKKADTLTLVLSRILPDELAIMLVNNIVLLQKNRNGLFGVQEAGRPDERPEEEKKYPVKEE